MWQIIGQRPRMGCGGWRSELFTLYQWDDLCILKWQGRYYKNMKSRSLLPLQINYWPVLHIDTKSYLLSGLENNGKLWHQSFKIKSITLICKVFYSSLLPDSHPPPCLYVWFFLITFSLSFSSFITHMSFCPALILPCCCFPPSWSCSSF